jgi:hypothetical protein
MSKQRRASVKALLPFLLSYWPGERERLTVLHGVVLGKVEDVGVLHAYPRRARATLCSSAAANTVSKGGRPRNEQVIALRPRENRQSRYVVHKVGGDRRTVACRMFILGREEDRGRLPWT